MRKFWILLLLSLIMTLGIATQAAANNFFFEASYQEPRSEDYIQDGIVMGIGYRFWGIFHFSANIYPEIIASNDQTVLPDQNGLPDYSYGGGILIPMGGFKILGEWQHGMIKWPTGRTDDFCEIAKIGLVLNISRYLSVEVYNRKLFNFYPGSRLGFNEVDILGAGIILGWI